MFVVKHLTQQQHLFATPQLFKVHYLPKHVLGTTTRMTSPFTALTTFTIFGSTFARSKIMTCKVFVADKALPTSLAF
jgi:hypothetical protein